MKKFYIYVLLVMTMATNSAIAASFIEGLEDIPIMNGLKQVDEHGVNFGNEESRLIEVYLKANNTKFSKVEKFYKDTLPQMGWMLQGKRENTLIFYREMEVLEITQEDTNPLMVRITVKNRN